MTEYTLVTFQTSDGSRAGAPIGELTHRVA